MDNDAFKELVRSKVKTTKEIAREAVEDDFRKKKRKRKGRGRRSDDDDDLSSSDSETENRRRENKREKVALQPTSVVRNSNKKKSDDTEDAVPRYRDRAKERREGKNADYKDSETMMETMASSTGEGETGTSTMDQAEISKYLGGDEAHTHLVKGLDVSLARSVRSQYRHPTEKDTEEEQQLQQFKPVISPEEAWDCISRIDTSATRSFLGRSMLYYWKGRRTRDWDSIVPTTAAGSAIQRSQFTFSVDGNPRNLATCWEIPTETNHGAITTQSTFLSKASPLDTQLIRKIQKVQCKQTAAPASEQGKAGASSPVSNNKEETLAEHTEDDSDEDIFQNVHD